MGSCIMGMLWAIASGFGMVDLAVQGIIRFVILDATMVIHPDPVKLDVLHVTVGRVIDDHETVWP